MAELPTNRLWAPLSYLLRSALCSRTVIRLRQLSYREVVNRDLFGVALLIWLSIC
jgi:hypothetical protein